MAAGKAAAPNSKARSKTAVAPRPVLQWIAAGLGLGITLGAAGVILVEALQPVRPVALSAEIDSVRVTPTSRIFEIEVTNAGSDTAAGVELVGTAGGETASVTLDYVPGDGSATASLAFSRQTSDGAPVLSIVGWSAP